MVAQEVHTRELVTSQDVKRAAETLVERMEIDVPDYLKARLVSELTYSMYHDWPATAMRGVLAQLEASR